ncbi:hypothetical protein CVT25_000542 [Psilocybe cyanescens]|uniref:Uncharacterized protein n=1 Tax=Psilocybe cyanescens TaxID=93625 RepID=A0A409WZS8_PSICY|nr:hypothetical protein CVT25_000542 [Psilocybe cyanescens]
MVLFSQIVNLSDTFGVLMIGTFVSAILLGGIYLQISFGIIFTYPTPIESIMGTPEGLGLTNHILEVSGKKIGIPAAICAFLSLRLRLPTKITQAQDGERSFRLTSIEQIPGLPETLAKCILASAAAIDITIAGTLSYYLHTKRTGFKQ